MCQVTLPKTKHPYRTPKEISWDLQEAFPTSTIFGEIFVLLFAALFSNFYGCFCVMFFFPPKKSPTNIATQISQRKKPSDNIWVCQISPKNPKCVVFPTKISCLKEVTSSVPKEFTGGESMVMTPTPEHQNTNAKDDHRTDGYVVNSHG